MEERNTLVERAEKTVARAEKAVVIETFALFLALGVVIFLVFTIIAPRLELSELPRRSEFFGSTNEFFRENEFYVVESINRIEGVITVRNIKTNEFMIVNERELPSVECSGEALVVKKIKSKKVIIPLIPSDIDAF